jgi:hypothetical protein
MQSLTPRERSRIVSLLDCFQFAESSVIHLHNTNRYVSSFVSAAKDALISSLKKLNVTLQIEQNGEHNNVSLYDDTEQRLMSKHELATLGRQRCDKLTIISLFATRHSTKGRFRFFRAEYLFYSNRNTRFARFKSKNKCT